MLFDFYGILVRKLWLMIPSLQSNVYKVQVAFPKSDNPWQNQEKRTLHLNLKSNIFPLCLSAMPP